MRLLFSQYTRQAAVFKKLFLLLVIIERNVFIGLYRLLIGFLIRGFLRWKIERVGMIPW